MSDTRMDIAILGLSITSSWGNGHAVTYRALMRELAQQGHRVLFLERDKPWYANNRDLPEPPYGETALYHSVDELASTWRTRIRDADLVVVGSFVPEGVAVGRWVQQTARGITAFYDIDTPVTLAKLAAGDFEYLAPELIPGYDLYLSFTGGPVLRRIERELGASAALPLYCSCEPELYRPTSTAPRWDLAYLGTYSADRQPAVEKLLVAPARSWSAGRFAVAGPQYPAEIVWPQNVERIEHLAPPKHADFYNAQRFAMNLTRAEMVRVGYSPSVRLFEAAACGIPVISDVWAGVERFFAPEREILLARSGSEVLAYLRELPEADRRAIGERARARVLREHTAAHRAAALAEYARRPKRRMNAHG